MAKRQYHEKNIFYNMCLTLPNRFRNEVCRQFSWSIPTFYRRMRTEYVKPGSINGYTRAEWQMLEKIWDKILGDVHDDFNKLYIKHKPKDIDF